jgi:hypothetical protein
MDRAIWSKLPTELIRKIIEESEPSIDVQLCFKIKPKKIPEARAWRLWYLLTSHDRIVYNLETKSLHNFRLPGAHIIRRPIELTYYDDGLWMFNETEDEHTMEIITHQGCFHSFMVRDRWATELRVLLRGSGLARALNVSDSTF